MSLPSSAEQVVVKLSLGRARARLGWPRTHGHVVPAVAIALLAMLTPPLVGTAAGEPTAGQEWTESERLARSDYNDYVRAAIADDGTAAMGFITIEGSARLTSRVRVSETGEWLDATVATRQYAPDAEFVAATGGVVAVAWTHNKKLRIRTWSGSAWNPPQTMRMHGYGEVIEAVAAADGTVAVMIDQYDKVKVATYAPATGWRTHPIAGAEGAWPFDLTISDDGHIVAALGDPQSGPGPVAAEAEAGPASSYGVIVARSDGGKRWTTETVAAPGSHFLRQVEVETSPGGAVALLWIEVVELMEDGDVVVQVSEGSGFDRQVLAEGSDRACDQNTLCAHAEFTDAGDLVTMWSQGVGSGVVGAIRAAGGQWATPVGLPVAADDAGVVDASVRADGSFGLQSYDDFLSCTALDSCVSVGVPDKWSPSPSNRFSFFRAAVDRSLLLVYGERACSFRCYDRPLFSTVPPA